MAQAPDSRTSGLRKAVRSSDKSTKTADKKTKPSAQIKVDSAVQVDKARTRNTATTKELKPASTISKPKGTAQKNTSNVKINPEERRRMIAEAAYLRAERRGFAEGNAESDWLEAEAEIDRLLNDRSRRSSEQSRDNV